MEARGQEGDEESQLLGRRSTAPPPIPADLRWPTIDGPLGPSIEESVGYARRFFWWGLCFLPLLWAINCVYFYPVLKSRRLFTAPTSSSSLPSLPFDDIRKYVVRSTIGLVIATVILSSWALTFLIGGEHLFGPIWKDLVMYNVAEKFGLTLWN